MKLRIRIVYIFISLCFCTVSQGFTVHTSYDASSDYSLGDIVPSTNASVLFYQATTNVVGGTHSLSNTSQWRAWSSGDIANNGSAPSEDVPDSTPTEGAPSDIPSDTSSNQTEQVSQAFTVHTSYEASSDYSLGDIVPSTDASVLFYQAVSNLVGGTHSLSNTSQWIAWSSSDIPNNGSAPSEAVPESAPTESAPADAPPDSSSVSSILADANFLGSANWYSSSWFGTYYETSTSWAFHLNLGWIYLPSSDTQSFWMYHPVSGWLWTTSSDYPWLYVDINGAWSYSVGFYDSDTLTWSSQTEQVSQEFTVHSSYEPSSDYSLGDIVPSADAGVLFYQALNNLVGGTHSLSNTSQWKAWSSTDIPYNGSAPSEAVPHTDPVFLSGQAAVISNPSAFNLVYKSFFDKALLDANASAEQAIADAKVLAKAEGQNMGIDLVKASPNTYGLFSAADLNASVASAQAEGVTEGKALGQTIGEDAVTSNPSAYSLVTQDAYDQMMKELMVGGDANATPFVEDWFYHPKRSWMWTTHDVYPYFYDQDTESWMYFQSGHEKPRFYHYGDEVWMTVE